MPNPTDPPVPESAEHRGEDCAAGPAPAAAAPPTPAEVARLRLAATPGLSPRLVARLVRELGSASAVLAASPARLASVPGVGAARAGLVAAAPPPGDVLRDLERARVASARVLVAESDGWPGALADLPDPPTVLWSRGDLAAALAPRAPAAGDDVAAALGGRGVAIVGSRRASSYGLAVAERLGRELAALGVPVVSGLARGIDAAAHRGALAVGGRTVGVLGGGLARFYPPEHVDSNTWECAEELVKRYGGKGYRLRVHGDATGSAIRGSAATQTDYDIIRKTCTGNFASLSIDIPPANSAVVDRVNSVNSALKGSPTFQLRIHPKCKRLIADLNEVRYVDDGSRRLDKKSDPLLTHISDALGYAVQAMPTPLSDFKQIRVWT